MRAFIRLIRGSIGDIATALVCFIAVLVIISGPETKTVTRPLLGPPSTEVQAAPGHPCDPKNYYLNCLYNAAGQELTYLPGAQIFGLYDFGIDFAWGSLPAATAKRGGARFAISYLSGTSKDWKPYLLRDYINHGIPVGFVYETAAAEATSGCYAGGRDARRANYLIRFRYGLPTSGPRAPAIFFAVDTDTSAGAVSSYFSCAHSVLGHRTGVYGSYRVVYGLLNRGLVGYAWQTVAWSYGAWDRRAKLEQTSIEHSFFGYSVDHNRRIAADAGLYPFKQPVPPVRCFGRGAKIHDKRCQAPRARVGGKNAEIRRLRAQMLRRGCRKTIFVGPVSFPMPKTVLGPNSHRPFCKTLFRIGDADHRYIDAATRRTY